MTKYKSPKRITLPHLNTSEAREERWIIYKHFMGHIRNVPVSRMEIKILSSIQFTADILQTSDAHVAKELIEMGLRAPRAAFPMEFLNYIDGSMMRNGWDIGAPSEAMKELHGQWTLRHDGAPLGSFRHVHSIVEEDVIHA